MEFFFLFLNEGVKEGDGKFKQKKEKRNDNVGGKEVTIIF